MYLRIKKADRENREKARGKSESAIACVSNMSERENARLHAARSIVQDPMHLRD
jgi:hypothetical protein